MAFMRRCDDYTVKIPVEHIAVVFGPEFYIESVLDHLEFFFAEPADAYKFNISDILFAFL